MKKILLLSSMLISTSVLATPVSLDDLYARYVEADYQSHELPEFDTEIEFISSVDEVSENLSGEMLLFLKSASQPDEVIARANPSGQGLAKFSKVKAGQNIVMKCQLQFTMNSDYLSFGHCELK